MTNLSLRILDLSSFQLNICCRPLEGHLRLTANIHPLTEEVACTYTTHPSQAHCEAS